ncbi:hypothetical protein BH11ACT8_BH11ACT8_33610 [soil metagenome]
MRCGHDGRRDDRGAATVVTLTFLGLVVLVGAALGVVGALVAAHRAAQGAADLAALAGARAAAERGDACAAVRAVAEANGARLAACSVSGSDVRVTVVVPGPRWLGQDSALEAQSRAGPAP